MTTVGYVLILVGLLAVRGMTKGRSLTQLPGDLGAMFDALATGNIANVRKVLALTGDAQTSTVTANPNDGTGSTPSTGASSAGGLSLLAECKRIGAGSKYVWGATGPTSYDCSGLVYRAMANLGIYKGLRFTTLTFALQCKSLIASDGSAAVGDVVVWHGIPEHMGVVDGVNSFYSALSPSAGIKSIPITGMGGTPVYYRLNGPNNYVTPTGAASTGLSGSVIPGIVVP
jgi:cell wall-associated NlpC family hydrolase